MFNVTEERKERGDEGGSSWIAGLGGSVRTVATAKHRSCIVCWWGEGPRSNWWEH